MHPSSFVALVSWVVLLPAASVASAPGESGAPPPVDPALAGRHLYESLCSSCHGDSAHGDGPLADLLRIVTPDLTRLAERNGGVFPATVVRERIDGTREVQAHGRRMMPVWGQVLDSGELAGTPEEGSGGRQIAEIVAYLESVQVIP